MKALRQMGGGFVIAVVSVLLVIGGISLSLAETFAPALPPTPSPLPTTFAVEFASPLPSPTFPPVLPTDTLVSFPTATLAQAVCTIPPGWIPIIVGANDTLYSIAERYKTTAEVLDRNNCLNNLPPAPGVTLYVPPVPTVTVIPCGPPAGWIRAHIVKAGENLYRISLLYRTTVAQLQSANCMGVSTIIHVGQVLWVPNVPTSTPAVTATATSTNTPLPSTATPTFTITPDFGTPTLTNTPAPTSTLPPTPSLTPFPSPTPTQ
ncbi:MAG: LysM peptidoglycan-binding domain-containing protein [Chloroflexota bacterium]